MRSGWDTFRGQHIGIQFLAAFVVLLTALLLASEAGWTLGGGATASPPAATPPVTQPVTAPPSSQTTRSRAQKAKHARAKAPRVATGPRYLCIYPGVGARHMISALPGGVTRATWAPACQATGGSPVARVSRSIFKQPGSGHVFELQRTGGGNFYVRLIQR